MRTSHQVARTAVLLINLGSPDAPTKAALKTYLREFLSDPRVVDLPRWQWLPVLYGIILQTRPKKSAKVYRKIWQEDGSPLIKITQQQITALEAKLAEHSFGHIVVDYAMRYGNPSIANKLAALKAQGVEQLMVIPMYPQYADPTTASVFDGVAQALAKQRFIPELRFVRNWHDHPLYIAAIAASIERHFARYGRPQKLLFSYHGEPKRYLKEGDPYFCHCHKTTRLVADKLGLAADDYQMVFQSLFGMEEWLKPYVDETIKQLAKDGVKHIAVICPGFSTDCLETLEEIEITNRKLFAKYGGECYHYIPALNASEEHIKLLLALILQHGQGWQAFDDKVMFKQAGADKAVQWAQQWQKTQRIMQ